MHESKALRRRNDAPLSFDIVFYVLCATVVLTAESIWRRWSQFSGERHLWMILLGGIVIVSLVGAWRHRRALERTDPRYTSGEPISKDTAAFVKTAYIVLGNQLTLILFLLILTMRFVIARD